MEEEKRGMEKGLWRNPMSYMGFLMSAAAALLMVVLLIIDFLAQAHSPYLGVIIFFILPVLLMAGFLLVGWGMWDEYRRRKRTEETGLPAFPVLDLNRPAHRRKFLVFMAGSAVGALLLTVIAYEAYHFTESLTFCGDLCHKVMRPERTAYVNSPHARVSCAECHVGPGASWYVRSKLSGLRELVHYVADSYPKPIPPAIENLRPARETCEECHWPDKFYGSKLKVHTHFGFDEQNTAHDVSMLVRIGGGERIAEKVGSGIHWHMLAEKEVTFVSADSAQQIIPLVYERKDDGTVVEYRLEGFEDFAEVPGEEREERLVDCVVCHNRPTHIFNSPDKSMDLALAEGSIDHTIPFIKRLGVEVLIEEYPTREAATVRIQEQVLEFYRTQYPELASTMSEEIDEAVETITRIYRNNFFPIMNVRWTDYPDNIGHWIFPGCFRCHDGKHVSGDGRVIRRDCVICHTMPESAPSEPWTEAVPEGAHWETWHPWDLKYQHAEMNCDRCHSGGLPPARDCATCHEQKGIAEYYEDVGMGDFDCSDCHLDLQKVRPVVGCLDCHEGEPAGLHLEVEDHREDCIACHEPHKWILESRDTCTSCHDDREDHYPGNLCNECHEFK